MCLLVRDFAKMAFPAVDNVVLSPFKTASLALW
jgi:hypothetical protein